MEITVSKEEGRVPITVFQIRGMLNLGTSPELEGKAKEEFESGMRYLLIDFDQVTSLSSAGLRAIQSINRMLHDAESADQKIDPSERSPYLKLVNLNPDIRRVVGIAGFDQFIDVFEDRQEAITSF
jgi:anti-anti-sigma factor